MEKKKILFITQEITPYLPETEMSHIGRFLPQGIQERNKEVRVFMPRFGIINERRNQLHEVIRLSGMNLIIDDTDHSLIIKVASIQQARMQVYFIDNEEYFKRKGTLKDKKGEYFEDNDERMIFFGRGAIETVKKLRWAPDIIHCHGWMSALVPLYIKKSYKDDPLFANAKVIYSLYNDDFSNVFNQEAHKKILFDGVKDIDIKNLDPANFENISKLAIDNSDGVILGNNQVSPTLIAYAQEKAPHFLKYKTEDEYIDSYSTFYDKILT